MNVSNPYDGERRAGHRRLPAARCRGAPRRRRATGEILLRGPNVFPGYWRRDDATRDAFDADGWFRSGDVGAFDDDGYLSIVGRAKELIISGGFNVYPREVEDVLLAHPGVAEVAVVGEPSDEWGEVVVAVVVADGRPAAGGRRCSRSRPRARAVQAAPARALRRRAARATRWARCSGTSSDRPSSTDVGACSHRALRPRRQDAGHGRPPAHRLPAGPPDDPLRRRRTAARDGRGPGGGVHRRSRLRAPAGCAGIPTHDSPSP